MEETNANVNERTKADSCRKPIRKRRIRRRRRSVGERPRENCSGNDWLVCCSSEKKTCTCRNATTHTRAAKAANKQTKHKRQKQKGRKRRCASLCARSPLGTSKVREQWELFFLLPLFFSFLYFLLPSCPSSFRAGWNQHLHLLEWGLFFEWPYFTQKMLNLDLEPLILGMSAWGIFTMVRSNWKKNLGFSTQEMLNLDSETLI